MLSGKAMLELSYLSCLRACHLQSDKAVCLT